MSGQPGASRSPKPAVTHEHFSPGRNTDFQRRGVGGALINEAHRRARQLGFRSVVVVGIEGYYPKFGYKPLSLYPIKMPFQVREENCLILALYAEGLNGINGLIEYAPEWMES